MEPLDSETGGGGPGGSGASSESGRIVDGRGNEARHMSGGGCRGCKNPIPIPGTGGGGPLGRGGIEFLLAPKLSGPRMAVPLGT